MKEAIEQAHQDGEKNAADLKKNLEGLSLEEQLQLAGR
jgi:hypothetical protein